MHYIFALDAILLLSDRYKNQLDAIKVQYQSTFTLANSSRDFWTNEVIQGLCWCPVNCQYYVFVWFNLLCPRFRNYTLKIYTRTSCTHTYLIYCGCYLFLAFVYPLGFLHKYPGYHLPYTVYFENHGIESRQTVKYITGVVFSVNLIPLLSINREGSKYRNVCATEQVESFNKKVWIQYWFCLLGKDIQPYACHL